MANPTAIDPRLGQRVGPHISLLACGHSHVARSVRAAGGLLIVNPGRIGLQAYDDGHPWPPSDPHRIDHGSPDARYAVVESVGAPLVL